MKTLFYSILLLINISLLAQSNNQENSGEKLKSQKQDKGGCTVRFHDIWVKAVLQTNASQSNIQLTWNNNFNPSDESCVCLINQILERQVGSSNYDTISVGYNDTSYIDTSILTGIAYNYRLWRRESCATSEFTIYSDTVISQTVGINEEVVAISRIYPIPANNFLFFETDQSIVGELFSVINISGNTIISGTISSNKMKLNIQELPKGFYFLRINKSVNKFIVN